MKSRIALTILLVTSLTMPAAAVQGHDGPADRPSITGQPDTPDQVPDKTTKPGIGNRTGNALNGLQNAIGNASGNASKVLNTVMSNTGERLGEALRNLFQERDRTGNQTE